jgi:CCR4-NOT transcription complex subunit 3
MSGMASQRKLQTEVDRVLKSITEHCVEFDSVLEKILNANTTNLKEKYEGDLKKEIKKLQRFRDQLKAWNSNNDIKNKKPLADARKQIEIHMERFKLLEKETKTKAYSKEGLSASMRGTTEEITLKDETMVWLDDTIEYFQNEKGEYESQLDLLKQTAHTKKKGKTDRSALDKIEELQARIDRHQWHINQIEEIKDKLDFNELNAESVVNIKDDVQYYIDSHAEPDFQEDETIYELLQAQTRKRRSSSEIQEEGELDENKSAGEEGEEDVPTDLSLEDDNKDDKANNRAAAPIGTVAAIAASAKPASKTPTNTTINNKTTGKSTAAAGKSTSTATKPTTSVLTTAQSLVAKSSPAAAAKPLAAAPIHPQQQSKPTESLASILSKAKDAEQRKTAATAASPSNSQQKSASTSGTAPVAAPIALSNINNAVIAPSVIKRGSQDGAQRGVISTPPLATSPPPNLPLPSVTSQHYNMQPNPQIVSAQQINQGINSLEANSNSNPTRERGIVADDYLYNLQLLEPSLKHLPDPLDSDRPKQYVPRNPYRTPSYFPSVPAPIFDDPALFEKLSVDTLFFIFYFQQGTPHQYLSARELKKQSWRYHKNFLTWFQRHDDPKLTTEEFEQGTYVYFDYESGWCQRIKSDFTFEYRHLEDELQVPVQASL